MRDKAQTSTLTLAFLSSKDALSRYLAGFFSREQDVEDALQDTYVNVLAAIDNGKTELKEPRAYLFRVARNIALNRIKRQQLIVMETIGNVDQPIVGSEAENRSSAQPDMADVQYRRDQIRQLLAAINDLPPQCKRVFLMQRVQGMSYKAIASSLGISTRTVEKHLEKALHRCAAHLAAQGYADDNVSSIDKFRRRKS